MSEYITFKNVSYSYDDYEDENEYQKNKDDSQTVSVGHIDYAVNNVDFSIKKGEFVAIVGRNGSGKSTLARTTNALLLPTDGTVLVNVINTKQK